VSAAPDVPPFTEVAVEPMTGAEVVAELRRVHDESVRYWAGYATAEFFHRPTPDVWSPADQVRHLTKAVRAVTKGFALPRIALRVLFGAARARSRSFAELPRDYRARLAGGGRAGRFSPRALEAHEVGEETRARLLAEHAAAIDACCSALGEWPERALDRYRIPHPLLGKLTVREMGYFTLYHNVHHVHVAERRRNPLP
jgi:hypothetical protein